MGKRAIQRRDRYDDTTFSNSDNDESDGLLVAPSKKLKLAGGDEQQALLLLEKRREKRKRLKTRRLTRLDDAPLGQNSGEAASLDNVIRQALISIDSKMLDDAFANTDLLVIRRTISDLPNCYIEDVLHQLINRILKTPNRMRGLGPWIRELLRQHIGFCMNIPTMKEALGKLYSQSCDRLRYHESAIKLQGHIDTILYLGLKNLEDKENGDDKSQKFDVPLLHFKEGTDSQHVIRSEQVTKELIRKNSVTDLEKDSDSGDDDDDSFDESIAGSRELLDT